jgi:hypothetical protein
MGIAGAIMEQELFRIDDVFEVKGKGRVLAGVMNEAGLAIEEIRDAIKTNVVLERQDHSRLLVPVLGTEVKHSCFSDGINVFILIPTDTALEFLERETRVLSVGS